MNFIKHFWLIGEILKCNWWTFVTDNININDFMILSDILIVENVPFLDWYKNV